eukprot:TRINITY_DN2005_c1_g1_i1.p1 TRINITY_DN2005_c1_g1~~TRINITY_DN2005_c1_g1_i1.p1  ORF type:complete len:144 (+),score=29.60 TRINITY_DN2005_c1_g1_i1:67-498(+)
MNPIRLAAHRCTPAFTTFSFAQFRTAKRDTTPQKEAKESTNPFSLFIKQYATEHKAILADVAAKWKTMTEEEKKPFRDQALENRNKRTAGKGTKKQATKYALFVKKHFSDALEEAKKSTSCSKEAFRIASRAVSQKYKEQQSC